MRKIIPFVFLISSFLYAQEALKSVEENYFDFLSLQGIVTRPSLNYRTLSDSEWNPGETSHLWQNINLENKKTLFNSDTTKQSIKLKIYGSEWFNSYNTKAPYGQNDGGLWQGKGYNTALSGGLRLEGYGIELTLKPQLSWSQNADFEYITPNYQEETFRDKAQKYGYYGIRFIDAPQRFGNSSFFNFDFGDTEIRYTWNNLTVGFGTQSIWLGPAQFNPIIHSNNAPSYPKIDIGLRKTKVFIPHFDWYIGEFEARAWWGKLSESDFFDNDDSNNENLISGVALGYSFPGFLQGLSLGINRTMLSRWNNLNSFGIGHIFIPDMHGGFDDADQRFSITFDYLIPQTGLEMYFEWARDDFSPNKDYIIRYPFHTQAWTFGTQKVFNLSEKYSLRLMLEITSLENSADYDRLINWVNTFYCHSEILQGYTNRGQWLGAGIGTGGNSQYLGLSLFYPRGSFTLFGQRRNPDLDYTMYLDAKNDAENIENGIFNAEKSIRANVDIGFSTVFFYNKNLRFSGAFIFDWEHNPLNVNHGYGMSEYRYNCVVQAGVKYSF